MDPYVSYLILYPLFQFIIFQYIFSVYFARIYTVTNDITDSARIISWIMVQINILKVKDSIRTCSGKKERKISFKNPGVDYNPPSEKVYYHQVTYGGNFKLQLLLKELTLVTAES